MCPLSLMISIPERVQVRCSCQQLEGSALEVIHRACDLDLSFLFESGQHAALLAYGCDCPLDIGLGHLIDELGVLVSAAAWESCERPNKTRPNVAAALTPTADSSRARRPSMGAQADGPRIDSAPMGRFLI